MKDTIIFDLDGTLALIDHRRHFVECPREQQNWDAFYEACTNDEPNLPLMRLMSVLHEHYPHVLIYSGRSSKVMDKTIAWLEFYKVQYDHLRMRVEEDFTPDNELKKKWAEEWGINRIAMVFDDRAKVVKMWRELGITCLQVAEGNF